MTGAPICPVTHSTLSWVLIAVFGAFIVVLVLSVASSWLQYRQSDCLDEWLERTYGGRRKRW